jgi:hypothetical protein
VTDIDKCTAYNPSMLVTSVKSFIVPVPRLKAV